jgi:hypothetical protein
MRYYLHGDYAEHDPKLIYCAKCDLFEPVAHFYERDAHSWSRHTDYERYEAMRKNFGRHPRRARHCRSGPRPRRLPRRASGAPAGAASRPGRGCSRPGRESSAHSCPFRSRSYPEIVVHLAAILARRAKFPQFPQSTSEEPVNSCRGTPGSES